MKISELEEELKGGDIVYKGFCHDCCKEVDVNVTLEDGKIEIAGGAIYKIRIGLEDRYFFKCDDCFNADSKLTGFRPCEVYSRVVGYLRPVQQYNVGKKEEYKMRKEFKV